MLLQLALILMTVIILAFVIAWMRSPQLRRILEEPKYAILDDHVKTKGHEMERARPEHLE